MKKQRPTIPIDVWKIAVNLEHTQNVQKDTKAPAFNCGCKLCKNWKASYKTLLPEGFYNQLSRSCIDLEYPTELYEFEKKNHGSHIRVQFHIVGKILDGPQTVQKTNSGRQLFYKEIRNCLLYTSDAADD